MEDIGEKKKIGWWALVLGILLVLFATLSMLLAPHTVQSLLRDREQDARRRLLCRGVDQLGRRSDGVLL